MKNMSEAATCHPDRPRKLKDGTCDRCYARDRYQNNPVVREQVKLAARKSWHKRQPELTEEQKRVRLARRNDRYKNDPEYRRLIQSRMLRAKTGITLDEYDELLNNQNGQCLICGTKPTDKRLAVDHDHTTGRVRGLLCGNCNTGIGLFSDSIERIRRAADYLRER